MSSKDDLRNFQLQLDQVNDGLTLAPDDKELLDLKAELTDLIALLKDQIKQEEAEADAKQRKWQHKKFPVSPQTASPVPDENTSEPAPGKHPESHKVGDIVSAKWVSGDGAYYPAKVSEVTGSSSHPYYTVQFLKWEDTIQTLPGYHLRVLTDDKKRKAVAVEREPVPKKVDPAAREAAEEKKRRKLVEKQELERQQKNWQNFAARGPKKRTGAVGKSVPIGSNSMFKTPETHQGRVGVVGSGKGMTEHGSRIKHKFKTLDED